MNNWHNRINFDVGEKKKSFTLASQLARASSKLIKQQGLVAKCCKKQKTT